MAEPTPEQLLAAYQRQVIAVRERVFWYADRLWRAQGTDLRDAAVAKMMATLVPKIQAGQLRVANLTSAYLGELAGEAGAAVDVDAILAARGLGAAEVYGRPGSSVYAALAQGKTIEEAAKAGLVRLGALLSTDLQMALVRQADAALGLHGFTYYRRVLTGRESCALCVIASTQRYRTGRLLPIHPGCDCLVQPIDSDFPLPQVIDQGLLDQVHDAVGSMGFSDRGARDLGIDKRTSAGRPISDFTDLVVTHEHGEIGPVLAWRKDRFTSAADLVA